MYPGLIQSQVQSNRKIDLSALLDGRNQSRFQSNSVIKSEQPYYYLSNNASNNRPHKKFNSVISFDRGSLYERALKRQELKKLNQEVAREREDREVAACSFQPNVAKSMMTYRGAGSPEKRCFNELYDHLMKPMIQKSKHQEMKPL